MNDALLQSKGLPSEAIQIINAGALKPQVGIPVPASTPISKGQNREPILPSVANELYASPAKANDTRLAKPRLKKEPEFKTETLVSVYVRLPSEIHLAIIKAAMERKLNKQALASQQAIMAEALTEWLQRNDYLK